MVMLSKPVYLISALVNIAGSILLNVGFLVLANDGMLGATVYFSLWSFALFVSQILALILYYKMWEAIQDGQARMSPGKAIGFLFIPFFGLYWLFEVIWGFSKDFNFYVERHEVDTKKLPEGLFLAFSILSLAVVIPVLNIVAGVVQWMVFSRICDGVNALAPAGAPSEGRGDAGPVAIGDRLAAGGAGRPLSLHCLSGEFAHETLVVPGDGVSIGRDPKRANLVLRGDEISGVHARLLPEPGSAQLWLEDLHSLNGTFYAQNGGGAEGDAGWVKLQGKILLSPGARFRLAVDGPEFEIRT